MNIVADLHTHTVASTHAYSTVAELAAAAEKLNLKAIGISDHGPKSADAPHVYYFLNIYRIPRKIGNVTVLRGAEANVDIDGNIDIDECRGVFKNLDYMIASMHKSAIAPGFSTAEYTKAWRKVIENPRVDILGHMGDPRFQFDIDEIVRAAYENKKIIEINNSSPQTRPHSEEICTEILLKCKEYGVNIALNSDAHIWSMVGDLSSAVSMVEKVGFPEDLIVNSSVDNLDAYFNSRPGREKIAF